MGGTGHASPRPPPLHFGDLTLVRFLGRNDRGDQLARWRCACGVVRSFPVKHVRGGRVRSCGCKMRGRGERPWEKTAGPGALPRERGKYPLGELVLFALRLPDGRPEALARGTSRAELARRALERMTNPDGGGLVAYGVCTFGELRAVLAAMGDA